MGPEHRRASMKYSRSERTHEGREVFSDVPLATVGWRRSIEIHVREGDTPTIAIRRTLYGAPAGAIYIHARESEFAPLRDAIARCKQYGADDEQETGRFVLNGGAFVAFSAGRTSRGPYVAIQHFAPSGKKLGQASRISGAELVALEKAAAALESFL